MTSPTATLSYIGHEQIACIQVMLANNRDVYLLSHFIREKKTVLKTVALSIEFIYYPTEHCM
jgi:hypothetical protein